MDDKEPDETPSIDKPERPRRQTAWDLLVTLDDIEAIEAAFEKAGMEIPPELGEHIKYVRTILEPFDMIEQFRAG